MPLLYNHMLPEGRRSCSANTTCAVSLYEKLKSTQLLP